MELQGALGQPASSPGSPTDKKGVGDKLGWFPFPAVAGGAGSPSAALGGGDGFSCSSRPPPACADFLKYLAQHRRCRQKLVADRHRPAGQPGADRGDPGPDAQDRAASTATSARSSRCTSTRRCPTSVGQALNDAIADFFAGKGSPQGIVDAFNEGESRNK